MGFVLVKRRQAEWLFPYALLMSLAHHATMHYNSNGLDATIGDWMFSILEGQ